MEVHQIVQPIDPFHADYFNNIFEYRNASNQMVYGDIGAFWFGTDANGQSISGANYVQTDVQHFTCPSDPEINDIVSNAVGGTQPCTLNTNGNTGEDYIGYIVWTLAGGGGFEGYRSNYVGLLGASTGGAWRVDGDQPDGTGDDLAAYRGVLANREKRTLEGILDGTSVSVMAAENIGTVQRHATNGSIGRRELHMWFIGCAVRGRGPVTWRRVPPLANGADTATPEYPNPGTNPDPSHGIIGHSRFARAWGVGSMHRSGMNVGYADGSINFIGRSTNWEALYGVMGAFDGDLNAYNEIDGGGN
jgi:prepilin-type processing-associated H-X9-DG protein